MCCFLSPTSSDAYFSFPLCWFGLSLPMSPRITHVKAAYTDNLFFSHASVLIRLCMGFLGAAVTKYHKQVLKTPEIDCVSVLEPRSLKSRSQQGHHPSESCKREDFLASVSLGCCRKTLIFLGL